MQDWHITFKTSDNKKKSKTVSLNKMKGEIDMVPKHSLNWDKTVFFFLADIWLKIPCYEQKPVNIFRVSVSLCCFIKMLLCDDV